MENGAVVYKKVSMSYFWLQKNNNRKNNYLGMKNGGKKIIFLLYVAFADNGVTDYFFTYFIHYR